MSEDKSNGKAVAIQNNAKQLDKLSTKVDILEEKVVMLSTLLPELKDSVNNGFEKIEAKLDKSDTNCSVKAGKINDEIAQLKTKTQKNSIYTSGWEKLIWIIVTAVISGAIGLGIGAVI